MTNLPTKTAVTADANLLRATWTGADIATVFGQTAVIDSQFGLSLLIDFVSDYAGYGKIDVYDESGSIIASERDTSFTVKNGRNRISPDTFPVLESFPPTVRQIVVEIRIMGANPSTASITPSIIKPNEGKSMPLVGSDAFMQNESRPWTVDSSANGVQETLWPPAGSGGAVDIVSYTLSERRWRFQVLAFSVFIKPQGPSLGSVLVQIHIIPSVEIFPWPRLIYEYRNKVDAYVQESIAFPDMMIYPGGFMFAVIGNTASVNRQADFSVTLRRILV